MAFHGWLAGLTEDVTAGDGLGKWTAAYYGLDIIYDNTGTNLVKMASTLTGSIIFKRLTLR